MKICVYAISKNEEKFAERWYNSMKEADSVVVLDTGSTDRTVELLSSFGAVVETQVIQPWRFDVARNASMNLIPPDTDICVCTDLDEIFEPGWRKKLEDAWLPGTTQARYRYTWNFNDDGSEGTVFFIEKAHAYGMFVWKHPVHEVLSYTGTAAEKIVTAVGVQLNHRADNFKSRASYLPLLELSVEEDPTDDRNMHYLGREYLFHSEWDKSIATLKRHLQLPSATCADERAASMRYIARCFTAKNQPQEALCWYYRAIAEAPYLREAYVEAALLLYQQKEWEGVLYFCLQALKISERTASYICEAQAWGYLPWDLAALGYYYTGNYEKALEYESQAAQLNPTDPRIQSNLKIMKNHVNDLR